MGDGHARGVARTGRRLGAIAVGGNPQAGPQIGGELWVPNHLEDTLSVVGLESGEVRSVRAGLYPSAALEVDGAVWVANLGDGTISVLPAR